MSLICWYFSEKKCWHQQIYWHLVIFFLSFERAYNLVLSCQILHFYHNPTRVEGDGGWGRGEFHFLQISPSRGFSLHINHKFRMVWNVLIKFSNSYQTYSSTDSWKPPIYLSDWLIFCCGNLMLHQKKKMKWKW